MARSTNIYLLGIGHCEPDELFCFTVKHEALSWAERNLTHSQRVGWFLWRGPDGGRGAAQSMGAINDLLD